MTLDPKTELTRQWLQVAADDLSLAELANSADPPLQSGVVYHCQQVFEKALKAFLVWHAQPVPRTHSLQPVPRTHSLPDLVGLCQQIDPAFSPLAVAAAHVSPYGTVFRYPPIVVGPTDLDATEALDLARDALTFVLARLPNTVRP
jgi:HEPN domain-containing protein